VDRADEGAAVLNPFGERLAADLDDGAVGGGERRRDRGEHHQRHQSHQQLPLPRQARRGGRAGGGGHGPPG
jgi:hypothetical protein